MTKPQDDIPPLEICRNAALRLLETRIHTVAELRRKLLRKKDLAPEHIETVLQDFIRVGLLNDADTARAFCDSLKAASAVGRRTARRKLLAHGVPSDFADELLDTEGETDAPGDSEQDRALNAAHKKWNALSRPARTRKTLLLRRQSLARFLAARGFSSTIIASILSLPDFKTPADTPENR